MGKAVIAMLCFVGGCAGGHSVATSVGGRDVSARSATANMVYVSSEAQAARFEIDAFRFSVERTHVSWGDGQSLALPADWKRAEFIHRGTHVAVRVDGRAHGEIRPAA